MRLGIDFGTTRTVVAAVHDGRHPVVTFDHGGEFREHVPGIAAMRGGELLVGWATADALASARRRTRSVRSSASCRRCGPTIRCRACPASPPSSS